MGFKLTFLGYDISISNGTLLNSAVYCFPSSSLSEPPIMDAKPSLAIRT